MARLEESVSFRAPERRLVRPVEMTAGFATIARIAISSPNCVRHDAGARRRDEGEDGHDHAGENGAARLGEQ